MKKDNRMIYIEIVVCIALVTAVVIIVISFSKLNKKHETKEILHTETIGATETGYKVIIETTNESESITEVETTVEEKTILDYDSNNSASEEYSQNEVEEQINETQEQITEDAINVISLDKLEELVLNNKFMVLSVFNGRPITTMEKIGNCNKVDARLFSNYAEFENMVYSVYCNDKAYYYINQGYPGFVNINGDLYFDNQYAAGGGYYVIWDDYNVTIDNSENNKCTFTVIAKYEGPSSNDVMIDYPIRGTAIFESGRWVLTEMLRD